jgi:hypothetical protein
MIAFPITFHATLHLMGLSFGANTVLALILVFRRNYLKVHHIYQSDWIYDLHTSLDTLPHPHYFIETTFSSTIANFAFTMRDHARPSHTVSDYSMLSIMFENMLTNVLKSMLVLALPPASLSVFGLILAAYLRLLRERNGFRYSFVYIQFIRSLAILFLLGCIASNIYGLRVLFTSFDDTASSFLYYSMIYFGGLGLVIYGSMAVIYFAAHRH